MSYNNVSPYNACPTGGHAATELRPSRRTKLNPMHEKLWFHQQCRWSIEAIGSNLGERENRTWATGLGARIPLADVTPTSLRLHLHTADPPPSLTLLPFLCVCLLVMRFL